MEAIKVLIGEEEDDIEKKTDLLTKLNFILSSTKSERRKLEALNVLRLKILKTHSNEDDMELE